MALLTLKDIGKIYVSEGNVAVGVRGVNLSFERGEFVAVTGKSGSGKSTLLNVISGMDTYEEGELFIEGEPTSHYLQSDWETYREQYISFIFQDYNIIDSFTVLQNVELALMHIEDAGERRARALELIDRVGLTSHIKHKGSKLSGGQKQRTVIARALAKDSPIILADEPTGNLDSATSAEIVALLREVSRDKLVIVVTHSFGQFAGCATRHIRIFDGAIESDHTITPPAPVAPKAEQETAPVARFSLIKKGFALGKAIFMAKPKLSLFLCLLMILGTLGIFLVTALCGNAMDLFEPSYMFTPIEGRVVVTTRDGSVLSAAEVEQLAAESGAQSYLRYDGLLDEGGSYGALVEHEGEVRSFSFDCVYAADFGTDIIGRYPAAENEIFLYLPISWRPVFGSKEIKTSRIVYCGMPLTVTGVKYYYDNNLTPQGLFTADGFRTLTAVRYLRYNSDVDISVTVTGDAGTRSFSYSDFSVFHEIEAGKLYLGDASYRAYLLSYPNAVTTVKLNVLHREYTMYGPAEVLNFNRTFTDAALASEGPTAPSDYIGERYMSYGNTAVMLSPAVVREMAEEVLAESYGQFSLFYGDQKAAAAAAELIAAAGYIAVPSDTVYTPDPSTTVVAILLSLALGGVWIMAILFLAFFINLCSGRALSAFGGDMAIMRSMGISVRVIRIAMYVRMLFSLIPAYLLVALTAVLIFTTPKFNEYFVYLYAWQYALIFVGVLLLTLRITYMQVRRLFGESVKKSLRGGAAA